MALRHALRSLPQLAARDARVRAGSGGAGPGEGRVLQQVQCGDTGPPPPCPPCPPAPRPCCRQTTPPSQYRLHVYCRPPPAGRAPPCPAAPPACSLSCSNYRPPGGKNSSRVDLASRDPCDAEAVRDRVWRRVEEARAARREAYLQDVNRKEETREECRQEGGEGYYSADGRSHHRDPPPAPRTPPAPHLVPRPGMRAVCEPQHEPGMSQCEHRPPVTVTVLRNRSPSSPAPPSPQQPPADGAVTCGRRDSPAGVRSWCDRPVPVASPPRCSGASFAERLRRRAAAPPPCAPLLPSKGGAPRRELHTCQSRMSLEEESRRLAGAVAGRGNLHEAGRGRERVPGGAGGTEEGRAFVGHVVVRAVSNERVGGGLRLEMSFDNDLFKFDTERSSSSSGPCPRCSGVVCGGGSSAGCAGTSAGKVARPSCGGPAPTPREVKPPVMCGVPSPRAVNVPIPSRGSCAGPVTGKVPTACPASFAAQKKPSCSDRQAVTKDNKSGADPCAALINKIFEPRKQPDPKNK